MAADYVVVVDIVTRPGAAEAFGALIAANAAASLREEPGCRRFDVCQSAKEPEVFLLYEIYDDAEAFAAHLKAAHFLQFDKESAALVASKEVRVLTLRAA
jgi:autoinducer 2-degrading protein